MAASPDPVDNQPAADRLADLVAQATALYAVKDYSPAAELYSEANELQAEMNGEMATENADLLYSYGKCLYFVAVRNSEVLGVSSAGAKLGSGQKESNPAKKRKMNGGTAKLAKPTNSVTTVDELSEDAAGSPAAVESSSSVQTPTAGKESTKLADKPYFEISGDAEDWDDSDSEDGEDVEAEDGGEGNEEEDQDDFSLAFEVLDLSRVLLLRKLDSLQQSALEDSEKGKYVASIDLTPPVRHVKERIADVHDLQAEISLEGERYSNAIQDLKSSLALKEELYPFESNYVAECHYKLSLALEFGSKTQNRDDEGNPTGEAQIDQDMLNASIAEMENAIESCQRRIKKEQVEVDNLSPGARKDKAIKDIDDVREIVEEMEQRLTDLRADPVDAVQEATKQSQMDDAAGILKDILGAGDKEEAKRRLDQATAGAKDLGGLVKRKKPKSEAGASGTATPDLVAANGIVNGTALGKRKVGFAVEIAEDGEQMVEKRARVEDTEDSGL